MSPGGLPGGPTSLGGVELGDPEIRRGLLFSFLEGLFSNSMLALTETFCVAAAVSLGASPMAIALLGSLPLLVGYVGLYLAPAVVDPSRGRRFYTVLGIRLQALLLFTAAFSGWLPPRFAPIAFIFLFVAAAVSSHVTGAFWVAWMGDLIPGEVRGRHWAWRNKWFSAANLSFSLLAGWVAREYDSRNAPWLLFFWVFASASALRSVASVFLARQHEPRAGKPLEIFSPLAFRPSRAFAKFSLATACFQGAAIMAAPFFTVWYLRDLRFNYLWLSLAASAHVVGPILFLPSWGRLVDRVGTAKVLRIATFMSAFGPLGSLCFEHPAVLCLVNLYSGGVWCGFGLANFSRHMSLTEKEQRHHFVAWNSLVIGLVGSAFGFLGGFLATRLPPLFGFPLRSLFLLSAGIRFAVWAAYFGRLKDRLPSQAPAARPKPA